MKNKKTKPTARKYYVAVVSHGEYDENDSKIVYVGENRGFAKEEIEKYKFPDPNSTWNKGFIEHWKKGKEIKTEYLYE